MPEIGDSGERPLRPRSRPWLSFALCAVNLALLFGLSSRAAAASSTMAAESRSLIDRLESAIKVETKQYEVSLSPAVEMVLPDAGARMAIVTKIGDLNTELGTKYNWLDGIVRYWLSNNMPLPIERSFFQVLLSDDIGIGRSYYRTKYLEHARGLRLGVGHRVSGVSVFTGVGRTFWRLAPYDDPSAEMVGDIDATELHVTTGRVLPAAFDRVQPDDMSLLYAHAFRGSGGDFHYDKFALRGSWRFRSHRASDLFRGHLQLVEVTNIRPRLPIRETSALGGAGGVKGYGVEEFRGNGVILAGIEHDWRLPFSLGWGWIEMLMDRIYGVVFLDGGRIEEDWFDPDGPWRWSVGGGVRLEGKVLRRYQGTVRLYLAQAEGVSYRDPAIYMMFDLK